MVNKTITKVFNHQTNNLKNIELLEKYGVKKNVKIKNQQLKNIELLKKY